MNIPFAVHTLVSTGIWLIVGIANINIGRGIRKNGLGSAAFSRYADEGYWKQQVELWGLVEPARSNNDEECTCPQSAISSLVATLMLYWGEVYAWGQIYSGIALVVTVLGIFITSLIIGKLLLLSTWFYWTGYVLSFVSGQGIGYIVGVYRLRARTSRSIRYADVSPRRLSSYRSSLWLLLSGAFVGFIILTTLILFPAPGSILHFHFFQNGSVPGTFISTWAGPVLLLLVLIASEIVMRHIAQLPRLLVTANPLVARRVDDLLRAKILAVIQGQTCVALAFLAIFQVGLLTNDFQRLYEPLTLIPLCITGILGILGIVTATRFHERLGGSITGWPWQHHVYQEVCHEQSHHTA